MPTGIYKHKPNQGFQKGNKINLDRKFTKEWRNKIRLSLIGDKNPMYGKHPSLETRLKRSRSMKGTKFSKEHNQKISEARKGMKFTDEHKENMRQARLKNPVRYWLGKKRPPISEETRRKMSDAHIGEKGANWLGGISFEPYTPEFNSKLKEKIRKRDNYRCQECFRHQDELYTKTGRKYRLLIHHIDYNKKNNQDSNLISLCRNCHGQTNFNREDWINYYKSKLN